MYNSFYGLSFNPFGKQQLKEKDHFVSNDFREMTNRLNYHQFEQFSKVIKKSALRLGFDILFFSGIREGELLALTPEDILPDRKLDINKTYVKIRGEELFLIPKTERSNRKVSIPQFLYDDIQEYISRLYGIDKKERIFYFTKSALDKEIKRGAELAGLEPIRVHDLRHSHVSLSQGYF